MNKIYLAYGSNLNLRQMANRCPSANILGTCEVKDYELVFRGRNNRAVANIEPCEGENVQALLWEIEPSDEEELDIYEGYPTLYRKEIITVEFEGDDIEVMAYVMNEGKPYNLPSEYYYNVILEGYITSGFDEEELKKAVRNMKYK